MLKRLLKVLLWIAGLVAAIVLVVVIYVQLRWNVPVDRVAPQFKAPGDSATIARGEYIYKYQALCWECHAPAGVDSPPSGGREFDLRSAGPGFGIWYSRNITPDLNTGIGGWTDGEVVQALREGVRKDRSKLFPLMPIDWYHGLSDLDALSVVAFLRSLPAVSNTVKPPEPSFFAKALFAFGMLKPMTPVTAPVIAPMRGATAAYGKYLASNVAGCMDCHTPRNLQNGQFYLDSLGAGSTISYGKAEGSPTAAYARNITPDGQSGVGSWSEEQFLHAVTGGMRPDGTVLVPHMPYAYYKFWTDEDLRAVHLFVRSLTPLARSMPPPQFSPDLATKRGIERGSLMFVARCQVCHGREGMGAKPTKVKLAEVVASIGDQDLRDFIRDGNPDLKMPSFGKTLQKEELDDLILYLKSLSAH